MMELESMAVEMPRVDGHPNRAAFRGVLTVVDTASERAPAGSKGHRVVLTRAAAEAALPSLLGMALDYAPTFDRHDQRRKVGVITSAEIVGRNLEVGGYLYAKDFPEVVEEVERSGPRSLPEDFKVTTPTLSAESALRMGHPQSSGNDQKVKVPTLSQRARQGWGNRVSAAVDDPTFSQSARKGAARVDFLFSEFPLLAKAARSGAPQFVVFPKFPLPSNSTSPLKPKPGLNGAPRGAEVSTAGARMRSELAAAVERIREMTRRIGGRGVPSLSAGAMANGSGQLGMSYEVADVLLADAKAKVWILTKVTFTGAAILRRDKAAYEETWIELV